MNKSKNNINTLNNEGFLAQPIMVALAVLTIALVGYFILKGNSSAGLSPKPNISTTSQVLVDQRPGSDLSEALVTITRDGFSPQIISVKLGQKIKWINMDTRSHSLSSKDLDADDTIANFTQTGIIKSGSYLLLPMEKTGTFSYNDPQNSAFKGSIIVE